MTLLIRFSFQFVRVERSNLITQLLLDVASWCYSDTSLVRTVVIPVQRVSNDARAKLPASSFRGLIEDVMNAGAEHRSLVHRGE